MEFFEQMDPLLKTYWYISIPASLIFLLQTILTFAGLMDMDVDTLDGPLELFSFRNLIHFLLGFSWSGIALYYSGLGTFWIILGSLIVGLAFVAIFFFILTQMNKLAEDNSFKWDDALGLQAEVYLNIPPNKSGEGQILVSIKGSTHQLKAFTNGEAILHGTKVLIINIDDSNTYEVSPINSHQPSNT